MSPPARPPNICSNGVPANGFCGSCGRILRRPSSSGRSERGRRPSFQRTGRTSRRRETDLDDGSSEAHGPRRHVGPTRVGAWTDQTSSPSGDTDLSVDEVYQAIRDPEAGGIALFVGTVRDHDHGK